MVKCKKCGKELPPAFGEMPRLPCPRCRSTVRSFSMTVKTVTFNITGGSARLVHTRPGLQSTAEADDRGRITLTATGPSPRNEEDSNEICARLVRKLNTLGADWSVPSKGEQDVDCFSTNSAGDRLQMQVTRASDNSDFWQQMNEAGLATLDYNASNVANELMGRIREKAWYPPAQKKELLLVLDAARTPSHTFQRVLDVFRELHLSECQNVGFAQIWVVGPQDSIVERLDR